MWGWTSLCLGEEIIGALSISGMRRILSEGVAGLKVALASSLSRILLLLINAIILEPLSTLPASTLLPYVSYFSLKTFRPLLRPPSPHRHAELQSLFHPIVLSPLDTPCGSLKVLLLI